ncbi:MAG: phosphatidylserine decarboxylase [Gammaproteobacteria bacterium]|jgi:phosphatidylserine decarboxylase|nr:phosphatidylserine decarboxylase [Gammaproteobacteria bacterium]MBT3489250.1 phosphatidylserine decarboxylase [Gammaproteobacteria bacterium]MBT3717788.1 phosphatidylserine decarboxylase [Gammaproteobacteria bacterium]MBT3843598.1 phosphatidylserine decarboxylase [Gammaproteobacteria bacterium]MBT3894034.1 phosphatidylserine decarboxylase [Gammaproteobacteria bacterium]
MTPILQYLTDRLFLLPLALLPHHRLSRVVHRLARSENRAFSQWLIRTITSVYQIDCSLAEEPDLSTYSSFNAFFTRSLKTGVRPIAAGEEIVVSPVDGVVSQCGPIMRESIFQAKGHQFNLTTLLGGDQGRAAPFTNGIFSTIYLSPRDYHRIHMPMDGTLREMIYIPGRLYPVNNPSTRSVPGLFARNERVAAIFETSAGPMAMVLVGALFVGSIETVWAGEITPPQKKFVTTWKYPKAPITLKKGDEMGRFNMGSTVILLFGDEAVDLHDSFSAGMAQQMGSAIASIPG